MKMSKPWCDPKDPNRWIMWKKQPPDTFEFPRDETPLKPLPNDLVWTLNNIVRLEHLRLVFAKICATLPEAAAMASKELLEPVSFYDYRMTSGFLGVDFNPPVDNLPANVVTGVIQGYNVKASERVMDSVRAQDQPGPKRLIKPPKNLPPTRQQVLDPPNGVCGSCGACSKCRAKKQAAQQSGQKSQPSGISFAGWDEPPSQALQPSQPSRSSQPGSHKQTPLTLPPQTQALAPQIALQAQQYGSQSQNSNAQFQAGPSAPQPTSQTPSIPKSYAKNYKAGQTAVMANPPTGLPVPQAGQSATQASPPTAQGSPPGPLANSSTAQAKASAKRKASETSKSHFPTCTTCNKSFNPDKNGPASCTHHFGNLPVRVPCYSLC